MRDPRIPDSYDADGMHVLERKRNPFMRFRSGGRVLSALMLPYFMVWPPSGFGVLTTTGSRTGKTRRRCIHAIRGEDKAYVVMIRPVVMLKTSAWVLNIRADPKVRLRMKRGAFPGLPKELEGVARELTDAAEIQRAREIYCNRINLFDYVECAFHRRGRPTKAKIEELHHSWFDTGIPLVIDFER
jgi:deazaflavin-dependent oxidoreductase (nitroreductase family)